MRPKDLQSLRLAGDELCLSTKAKAISLDELKALFPSGKLEDNYIIDDIKELLRNIKTERKIIDLTPELTEKDYGVMQMLMNRDNGKYIEAWKGFSDTDMVPNRQKLALFTRTLRLTKQVDDFLDMSPEQWKIVYEGIVTKPRDMIMPMLKYKVDSNPINIPLGENKITSDLKDTADKISEYIDMFTVKDDFIAHRGDKSFRILSGVKYEGQNISLADLMEIASTKFRNDYIKGTYNEKQVNSFINRHLINKDIEQKRFMSIGMTESSVKDYAKKIKWKIKVPKGTKGTSIESFNVERLNEAEFLGQRNGILTIEGARYSPKEDLWYFDAVLEQNPIDELVVNC